MTAPQQLHSFLFGRGDVALLHILADEPRIGLPLEVTVRPAQLSRHEPSRFNYVIRQIQRTATQPGRPLAELRFGKIDELGDYSVPGVAPRLQQLIQELHLMLSTLNPSATENLHRSRPSWSFE